MFADDNHDDDDDAQINPSIRRTERPSSHSHVRRLADTHDTHSARRVKPQEQTNGTIPFTGAHISSIRPRGLANKFTSEFNRDHSISAFVDER